ncbi:MAG: glycosyltransferase [Terrimicrobiaceae bacterium]
MRFGIVIPAYNEAERLPSYAQELCDTFKDSGVNLSITIVDDGSSESNRRALLAEVQQIRSTTTGSIFTPVHCLKKNIGKGGAVRAGWDTISNADYLGFIDADGSVSAIEVLRVLSMITKGSISANAVFASRIQMLGYKVKRRFLRHMSGRLFATIGSILLDYGAYDTQCGFKLLSRSAYNKVKPLLIENGFSFDLELLAALFHCRISAVETPINWHEVGGSKVNLAKDTFRMLLALIRIRKQRKRWLSEDVETSPQGHFQIDDL